MLRTSLAAVLVASSCCGVVRAQVTFELISEPWFNLAGSDVSADGNVIVGNQVGPYETFRWTEETGFVLLGRGTVAPLGAGAGSPDVSHDGTRVSATVLSADETATVAGIWEDGEWTLCEMLPPDAQQIDANRCDSWGLSGDGSTVVGLYWRSSGGQPGSSAYPMSFTPANGQSVRLGPGGVGVYSGRANAANYDGTVVVGWRSDSTGAWQPTVWENGVETVLEATPVRCELFGVNDAGTVVVGMGYVGVFSPREAAFWTRSGSGWAKTPIGVLPGTTTGQAYASDVSADGSVIVGGNIFTSNPGGARDGFIWTPGSGMVNVAAFLADNGVEVDPFFDILELTAVTPDGRVIVGLGRWTDTFDIQTFRITLFPAAAECPGNADGIGGVDFNDVVEILGNWSALTTPWQGGDANGDGVVDFNDIVAALGNWGAVCP